MFCLWLILSVGNEGMFKVYVNPSKELILYRIVYKAIQNKGDHPTKLVRW